MQNPDNFKFDVSSTTYRIQDRNVYCPSRPIPTYSIPSNDNNNFHFSIAQVEKQNRPDGENYASIVQSFTSEPSLPKLNENNSSDSDFSTLRTPPSGQSARTGDNTPSSPNASNSMSTAHQVVFIMNVCAGQFLALSGLSQSIAPLFIIGDSLDEHDPGELSWYAAAFSLAVGTFLLPAGRLGDIYGHKTVFVLGWSWYALMSFIVGFSFVPKSGGSTMFKVCRGLQGLGPAMIVPNAMALIGVTFPVGLKRNIVFSIFGASGPVGFAAGAIFSSLLSQYAWWPWSFWLLATICTSIALSSLLIIPGHTFSDPSLRSSTSVFDYKGAITGVSGLVLLNFAFNQAPIVGWKTAYIPVILSISILLLTAFVYLEVTCTTQPLIPVRSLTREAWLTLACVASGWSSHGIWLYYFFQFTQLFRHASAVSAALQIAPVMFTGVVFALSTGFLAKRIKTAYIMLMAMCCFTLGAILLACAPVDQTYWGLSFASVLIMPGGMNWSFPAATILLSNGMPREHQGISASLVSTMVNYSISTGLGLAGTVNRYVSDKHGALSGVRAAWYLGIGMDTIGLAIAGYFVWTARKKP